VEVMGDVDCPTGVSFSSRNFDRHRQPGRGRLPAIDPIKLLVVVSALSAMLMRRGEVFSSAGCGA
jgi:hypothetical protein